jgi:hypothetical protein
MTHYINYIIVEEMGSQQFVRNPERPGAVERNHIFSREKKKNWSSFYLTVRKAINDFDLIMINFHTKIRV